jgi:TRAP-type C4-dicarboxylate transport system permease small subunit
MLRYVLRFPSGYVAALTKSLCIAQDFLTAIWLCWSSEQAQFRASHSSKWWKRHRPDASFPQAMTVIVLAAVGFLACAFFFFVLFQWMRDTKRKTTTVDDAAGETSEKKRPQVVGFRRAVEKRDRF